MTAPKRVVTGPLDDLAVLLASGAMLSSLKAAAVLGVTAETLRDWRSKSRGPKFVKYANYGPVFYPADGLAQFIRESASKYGGPR